MLFQGTFCICAPIQLCNSLRAIITELCYCNNGVILKRAQGNFPFCYHGQKYMRSAGFEKKNPQQQIMVFGVMYGTFTISYNNSKMCVQQCKICIDIEDCMYTKTYQFLNTSVQQLEPLYYVNMLQDICRIKELGDTTMWLWLLNPSRN